jgi:hypothetical protein
MSSRFWICLGLGVVVSAGFAVTAGLTAVAQEKKADAAKTRYFEMRTYIANPGKLDALNARFRDHTCKLFAKHGMECVGFWTPTSGENAENTLIYILAYPSKEACEASWKAFRDDPDWKAAKEASEKDGVLVGKVISTYLAPTDYSPIR